jgi:hypothetical protein
MASEDYLFLRKAELIVGPKVSATNGPVEPVFARVFKTRINFEVGQDSSGNANKAKIKVYNLSEESRTFLEQKDLVCFLMVGYESTGLSTLFFGDIDEKNGIHVERSGPDIIVTIEAGDAEKTIRESNIQLGLAQGATNLQIIEQAASKLLVSTAFKTTIKSITYQNGFSYSGSVKKLLNQMGEQAGFEWSVQNGELLILGPAETDKQEAIFLSKETGLIGFPTKTQDKVEFISLLNPKIRPGRAVRLESQIFLKDSGANVKVEKTTFSGDTQEGSWQVKVEGKIL